MHLDPSELPLEPQPDNHLALKRLVTRDQHGPSISMTWVDIDGRHRRLVTKTSDRVYYVLSGSGTFRVDDRVHEHVEAGHVVTIPRDTPYELEGDMTYLVINSPAYAPGDDEYLE